MSRSKIAIITTVANFELYKKTSQLFPNNIRKYVIDGTNGMHGIYSIFYLFKKLKNEDIKWLIMADEDVILKNNFELFSLINKMEKEEIACCGVRDGGMISHRNFNPFVINTFFSIINFQKIKSIFSKNEIIRNQFIAKNEFDDDLTRLNYDFHINSLYEPYYCFYLWLRRKGFKMLFLNTKMHDDGISNYVLTPNGSELLIHTWYARSYGENIKHTKRINKFLKLEAKNENFNQPIYFKDQLFSTKRLLRKNLKRIKKRF